MAQSDRKPLDDHQNSAEFKSDRSALFSTKLELRNTVRGQQCHLESPYETKGAAAIPDTDLDRISTSKVKIVGKSGPFFESGQKLAKDIQNIDIQRSKLTIQSNLRTSLGEVPVLDHRPSESNSVICRDNSGTKLLQKHVHSLKTPTNKKIIRKNVLPSRKYRQKECMILRKYKRG